MRILLFGNHQQPDRPVGWNRPVQPLPVGFHRIHAAADAGIDGKLHHIVSIPQQEVAKAGGRPPLFLRLDREIKKDQHPHKSTHRYRAARAAAMEAPVCCRRPALRG